MSWGGPLSAALYLAVVQPQRGGGGPWGGLLPESRARVQEAVATTRNFFEE